MTQEEHWQEEYWDDFQSGATIAVCQDDLIRIKSNNGLTEAHAYQTSALHWRLDLFVNGGRYQTSFDDNLNHAAALGMAVHSLGQLNAWIEKITRPAPRG